jgi:dipeptidase E
LTNQTLHRIAALEKSGAVIDELEISTATGEEISRKLQSNDAIYITGGTFFFFRNLKERGPTKS